jgi:Zn-dependent protease
VEAEGFTRAVLALIPLVLSFTVHEFAHAWSAWQLGDPTAKEAGRLTLNPVPHLDIVGSIVLPLLLFMSGGLLFGWARPTPVNPALCVKTSPRWALVLTSMAGPVSNFLLTILSAALLWAAVRAGIDAPWLIMLLRMMISLNVLLGLFNLIPVPPLDGSRVVFAAIPAGASGARVAFVRAGPLLLIAVLFFGGRIIGPPYNQILDRIGEAIGVGVTP